MTDETQAHCTHFKTGTVTEVGPCETRLYLSKVIRRAENGERLTRVLHVAKRRPGLLSGRVGMAANFDETPESLAGAFGAS
jgi:hypothetical protein